MKSNEYISLKEASEISGYSPDYVGQLIRGGKLPGKQVFQHVVWVTTEEDVRSYMETKRITAGGKAEKGTIDWKGVFSRRKHLIEAPRLAIRILYVAAAAAAFLFLLLFYVFASSVEHRLNEAAIQTSEAMSSP